MTSPMTETPRVALVMGSESDLPVMESAVEMLERFGVPFQMRVLSAHRSPRAVEEFARAAAEGGTQVIIAAAGGAAHLAGVLAAATVLPVIGVPMPTDRMGGMDSLLSTVQMPSGVPVATMGLGRSGAANAAVMAVRILACAEPALREALARHTAEMAEHVGRQDEHVRQWLEQRRQG